VAEGGYAITKIPKLYKAFNQYLKSLDEVGDGVSQFKNLGDGPLINTPKGDLATGPAIYRGGNGFEMSAADINNSIDATTGLMKENGVSLNLDKNYKFIQQYGGAFEVDISSIPKELKIKQTKGTHYEITPNKGGTMTLETYQGLLKQVKVKPLNTIVNK
jgi:hypothetical protein